jgi:hypothetical protein
MSDQPVIEATAAAPEAAPAVAACPITDDFLPPNMKKHVDPKAPVPLRMMAAKGLVPLQPADLLGVLFMLSYDADPGVRETCAKTAAALADRQVSSAFRDEGVKAPVLGWFLEQFASKDAYAEMLILNATTPDEAVAKIASSCSKRTAEIIGNNQLRFLRHDNILRELAKNPEAQGALIDGVCDFAVRSGMNLPDVPQVKAARIRLFGPDVEAKPPPDPGPTADQLMQELDAAEKEKIAKGGSAVTPLDEGKRLTLAQKIMKMSISEKIKLATMGNKEARSILIRESNKLVATAVIRSPRITDGEVLSQAQNKAVQEDVLRIIYGNREWLRVYSIKMALVKNPKVPTAITMKLLNTLQESDIKSLAKDKNVPGAIQLFAKKMIEKKEEKEKGKAEKE